MNFVIVGDPQYGEANGERLIVVPEAQSTHSQLARGQAVKYSGEMGVEGGRITWWNTKAGHYRQPSLEKAAKWKKAIPDIARSSVMQDHPTITRIAARLKHNPARSILYPSFRSRKAALDARCSQVEARGAAFERYFGAKLGSYSDQISPAADDDTSTTPLQPELPEREDDAV